MDRRCVVRGAFAFVVCALSLPASGFVPLVLVKWAVLPKQGASDSKQDIERLRQLLNTLGYVKGGEERLPSGLFRKHPLVVETFSFSMSGGWISVKLAQEASGTIYLWFVERVELSSMGRQQVTFIAEGLEKEFGHDRVVLTSGELPNPNVQ